MKRIGSCSFGINKKEFPIIKFSSNKQGREENIFAINKERFLKTAKLLYDNGEYEDALLIHITLNNKLKLSEFYQVKWDGVSKREKITYYNERCFLITFNLSRYALYASEGVCS